MRHVGLPAGRIDHCPRDEADDEALAELAPWIEQALVEEMPLPSEALAHCTAICSIESGALWCTVLSQLPVATFAVITREGQSRETWASIITSYGNPGLERPDAPWYAVALREGAAGDPNIRMAVADFARRVAWSWLERNDTRRSP